ncbi:epimerase family protein SDR39U1-like [Littorina saxatilis]|uniref:Epimerase family protein SDR39U1 n=1 Tax=Littorina saxatilis TaxID=31220 RepID=A0AAN9C5T4_9CAEN
MSVLIGGGTGFVGRHLTKLLAENGLKVTVVSRAAGPNKITWSDLQRTGLPDGITAVVSMSGENILNPMKRWNESFKQAVWSSRVDCTQSLANAICQATNPPKVLVSMSGVGYYKPDPTAEYDEDSPGGDFDYLSELCTAWEAAAKLPSSVSCRQAIVRSGVVLGRDGGMIQQIYWPFFLGAGGRIGSGAQWFPWVHVADVAGIITHAIINDHVSGVLNAVAPEPATNAEFTKAFASAMWRPSIFPVPGFVMNTVYGPERGKVILEGQKVIPKKTLESGYKFAFPDLKSACQDVSQMLTITSVSGS